MKKGGRPNRGTGQGKYLAKHESGGPAKGEAKGTRQPFQPGHTLTVKHGVKSPRIVNGRAAEFVRAAETLVPFLAEPSFSRAVLAWARAEARCDLLAEYLEREGLLDEKGEPRSAATLAVQMEKSADNARKRLGLDPTARAQLEKDFAEAGLGKARLEAAMEAGRELRLAAEAQVEDDDWDWDD